MRENSEVKAGEARDSRREPLADLAPRKGREVVIRDGEVRLRASRSRGSGAFAFPPATICPETGQADMEPFETEGRGTLYSHSTVHVSAAREVPYTIGYVDFPCGLRVLALVKGELPEGAGCDLPVVLRADEEDWWVEARNGGVAS